jgi:hypothetical protein
MRNIPQRRSAMPVIDGYPGLLEEVGRIEHREHAPPSVPRAAGGSSDTSDGPASPT